MYICMYMYLYLYFMYNVHVKVCGQLDAVNVPPPLQASHTVLWHGLSELQVLLRLDLEQTASARKETMIKTLILKGALKAEVN